MTGLDFDGGRWGGVLLHPTSLPGPGIGDLGSAAYRFVDWLVRAGQSVWQILPLVPVDSGGSPYNGLSALAGNPLLIAPELLERDGLVEPGWHQRTPEFPSDRVDFAAVRRWKIELLENAYWRFRAGHAKHLATGFDEFREKNDDWLRDYSIYRAVREHYRGAPWTAWPADLKSRTPEALERWRSLLAEEIESCSFRQYLFDRQWRALRRYANDRGVRLFGDLPIFVALDSADVWANAELFHLDAEGSPTVVSGVPPDYFSARGQRWGNPLYRWDVLRERGYDWWVRRFSRTLDLVDLVRVDHFRGFESYWEIDASEETAINGRWVPGPGARFFREVAARLGDLPIVAEDLGMITRAVEELRDELGFPGMRVLQFAFDGDPRNPHLPENHVERSVAYTGTHDNDTLMGWWAALGDVERRLVRAWLHGRPPDNWSFIEGVLASRAALAIIPIQDVMGLGSEARMNRPGETAANWTWRLAAELPADLADRLHEATVSAGRSVAASGRVETRHAEKVV